MSSLRYRAWTKATQREKGTPRYSANWAVARRSWLRVYDDRIECGDWTVAADSVDSAVLYHARQYGIPVTVLALASGDRDMQFGFNPWVQIEKHLPFECRHETVDLKYSKFSAVARVVVVLGVLYWLWRG